MQTKKTLDMNEILLVMDDLNVLIEDIENYPDKSLFFQNPEVFDRWLALVRAIQKIESWDVPGDETKWEQRTETCVEYYLSLRNLRVKYEKLYQTYHSQLKNLLDGYGGWLFGKCFSGDGMEAMSEDQSWKELGNVEDTTQYLTDLNTKSLKARSDIYTVLSEIYQVLLAIMNRGGVIVISLNPYTENFAKAIDDDLREWTNHFGNKLIRDMKEDLNRHYKTHRTDHNTIELWSDMLDADEKALNKAKKQQLVECNDPRQEHWGEDMKRQMDENGRLMQQILSSCRSDELLDLRKAENIELFIPLLTPNNLNMFYEIIVRRNLIQCEMFPELKEQHEVWLNNVSNNVNEQSEENNDTGLNAARQSKLDEIIGILQKGDWKQPATAHNIELLLNTVFGKDASLLDDSDAGKCEKMWALVEGGGGERMLIVPANLAGFFKEENLLKGSPKEISTVLFGNGSQVNNINKGNSNRCSEAFKLVIPFIRKYIDKIIRHV